MSLSSRIFGRNFQKICIRASGSWVAGVVQRPYHVLAASGQPYRPQQATRFRAMTDFSLNSEGEDLVLASPLRSELVKTSKNMNQVLRFLKLVTEQEKRPEDFLIFARRCEGGYLTVEKDVYITKNELLTLLWKNGYSELEMNAYEIAFDEDYNFSYPELSALFALPQEDCYEFCIKTRAADSTNALISLERRKPGNLIAQYGLLMTAAWYGLQNQVLGNIWMFVKTLPFMGVFLMLAIHFQKSIAGRFFSAAATDHEIGELNRLAGETAIYNQIRAYAADGNCLQYVEAFKQNVGLELATFRSAKIEQQRALINEAIVKHLKEVEKQERKIELQLQEVMVEAIMEEVRKEAVTSRKFKEDSFNAALEALKVKDAPVEDALAKYVKRLLADLRSEQLDNDLINAVRNVLEKQEREFLQNFTITENEKQQVRKITQIEQRTNLAFKIAEKIGLAWALKLPAAPPEAFLALDEQDPSFARTAVERLQSAQSAFERAQIDRFLAAVAQ